MVGRIRYVSQLHLSFLYGFLYLNMDEDVSDGCGLKIHVELYQDLLCWLIADIKSRRASQVSTPILSACY